MEKWWSHLSEEELEKLEKEFPGYKELEYPTLYIRWFLESLNEERLRKQGKSSNAWEFLTEEEIAEDIAFCKAYKEKYGVRYKDPPISEIDKQRDKEFREEYYKNKSKS